MSSLPLVACDRLHARLLETACVRRYTATREHGAPVHSDCAGCPQGEARRLATLAPRRAPPPAPVPRTSAPYRPGRPYHPARLTAVAAVRGGERANVVAARIGVARGTLADWLAAAGVQAAPRPHPTHPRRAEGDALLAAGTSPDEVAVTIGVSPNTTRRWAREHRAASVAAAAGTAPAPVRPGPAAAGAYARTTPETPEGDPRC